MSNLYYDPGEKIYLKQKVLLCTTAYDTPSPGYVFSLQQTRSALEKANIQTAYLMLVGNCHVDDARNSVVQQFLLSDCTDLIFLDADVSWKPADLIKLCKADADVVGGIYPYRRDDKASKERMPVLMCPDVTEPDKDGLLQVAGLPTGFLKIRRHVLESLSEDADHYWNKADRRSKVPIIFERTFENGTRWGGDITFCRKWHKKGGQLYALPDLRLGHAANSTIHDSLSAALRRQGNKTLKYMADKIKNNDFTPHLFSEVLRSEGSEHSALEDVLMMGVLLSRKAQGPIIEAGSGITSIAMAAATKETVYCLEHDPYWAGKTTEMAKNAGVDIKIKMCGIKDGWYIIPDDLPGEFALGLNDGPPRDVGDRLKFFDHFGETDTIIVDDADDVNYGHMLKNWCATHNRKIDFIERSALIRR